MRKCSKCNEYKPESEWTKSGSYCRICVRIYNAKYRNKIKEKTGWVASRLQNLDPNYRTCNGCFKTYPIENFRWAKKDIKRANDCNECHRDRVKQYYTQPSIRSKAKENKATRRIEYKFNLYMYLVEHPCIDCGERNPIVLDFDHIDPKEKVCNVGRLGEKFNWELSLTEIAKCEVRCSNCHRIKTYSDCNAQFFRWWYGLESIGDYLARDT